MTDRCCGTQPEFDGAATGFRRVLWAVIAINATMFVVETTAGLHAESMALRADALDFLGDSLTYALSLAVIGRSVRWRAGAALVKGASLALMGTWVLGATAWRVLVTGAPDALVMGSIGLLALAANLAAVGLLLRWREGDANVRSVWLCSRNDAIGNVAVVLAAGGVLGTGSALPDLIVAAALAGLFLYSATHIVAQARRELAAAGDAAGALS